MYLALLSSGASILSHTDVSLVIRAAHASIIFLVAVYAATGAMSLVVATFFSTIECDPIRAGQISSANQVG